MKCYRAAVRVKRSILRICTFRRRWIRLIFQSIWEEQIFSHTEFETIYASFFPENTASKRVMEKCGMTFSHVNKNEFTYLGKERDLIYYKIRKAC